jgi:hypothetical protein
MPRRPDFYRDLYCAAWDGLRGRATGRHGTGSPSLPSGVAGWHRWGRQRRGRWRRLGRRHPRPQRRVLGRRSTASLPKPQLREPRSGRAGAPTVWGGYSGIFIDPDGHAWEIAHTPAGSSATTGPFGSIDRRATRTDGLRTTRIAPPSWCDRSNPLTPALATTAL